jgi:hypothetical protein
MSSSSVVIPIYFGVASSRNSVCTRRRRGATESRDGGDDGRAPLSEVVVRQTVDHRRVDRHVLVMSSPLGPDAAVAGRLEAPGDNVPVAAYGDDPDRLDLYSPHLYKARRNTNSP